MAATRPLCVGFSSATRVARFQLGNLEVRFFDEAAKRERTFVLSEQTLRIIDLQLERWRREAHEARLLAMNGGNTSATMVDAAKGGGVSDLTFLLSRGADVNFVHNYLTALRLSAHSGYLAVVTALLDAGAVELDRALRLAASRGHTPVVALLLNRGADIQVDNGDALRWSAYYGHLETVRLLLDRGADIHAQNDAALCQPRFGDDANAHNFEMTRLLLDRRANIHAQDDKLFRDVARTGQLEMTRLLLDRGAYIHAVSDEALRTVADQGELEMFQLLLVHGANVNALNDEALYYAARRGNLEMVRLLLEKRARVYDASKRSSSSRIIAAAQTNGFPEVVELLKEYGSRQRAT